MIVLDNVTKVINDQTVLGDISYCFLDGKTYGLKGINGSGKTMLMRMISGLIYPTHGTISINEKILHKDISFPPHMGMLLENPAFLDGYTGYENLEMLAQIQQRIGRNEICEALSYVGLDPMDKRKYRKYSLGMKQRLGIAASIMEDPDVIIWDEPLNALDTKGVELFEHILNQQKKKQKLMILACHDDEKIKQYADVLIYMENGKIIRTEEQNHE